MMKTVAVIPARYGSTRFPGKPLALLWGKPVLQHVYERVSDSGLFGEVIVATDDERIATAVKGFGGRFQMTDPDHPSGSDRIAEVVTGLDCELVFNVQGDEPLIESGPLASLKTAFTDTEVRVATLMARCPASVAGRNANVVKVVFDLAMNALYFSRSAIPCYRDAGGAAEYYRHIGVYAYRRQALLDFVRLPQTKLELAEKLEQLRLLENGIPIRMVLTDYEGIGIDTPEDLAGMAKQPSG